MQIVDFEKCDGAHRRACGRVFEEVFFSTGARSLWSRSSNCIVKFVYGIFKRYEHVYLAIPRFPLIEDTVEEFAVCQISEMYFSMSFPRRDCKNLSNILVYRVHGIICYIYFSSFLSRCLSFLLSLPFSVSLSVPFCNISLFSLCFWFVLLQKIEIEENLSNIPLYLAEI